MSALSGIDSGIMGYKREVLNVPVYDYWWGSTDRK